MNQDGGFVMAYGECVSCRRVFGFNPTAVPSIRIKGTREPVCASCFDRLNAIRVEMDLEPWTRRPDAYEPLDERDLAI